MNIKPISGPSEVAAANQPSQSRAQEARAKAIAMLQGNSQPQAQQQPVQQSQQEAVPNPSQVQPEEMHAVKAPQTAEITNESRQEDSSVETPTEAKPPEETALSRQFAQLARQEKQLRAKAQQQEASFNQRLADLEAREAKLKQAPQFDPKQYVSREQIKRDAMSVLSEEGISYDDITQQYMTHQPTDPRVMNTINELKQALADIKAENETIKQTYSTNQDQAYKQAVKQLDVEAANLLKAEPDTYEFIVKANKQGEITKLIEQTWNEEGILMTVEEAAQQVEDFLIEQATITFNKINKLKQKLAPVAPKPASSPAVVPAANQQQQQQMKTLTNAAASTRKLSNKERAILAFKGELKS